MEYSILHRRERLVLTTIEIIDELGIQGLSTREIARRQEVSEATLFRHYKSKNDLLSAVLDNFSKYDQDIFESIALKNLKPKESIRFLIGTYAAYYESYPAITSILQLFDVLRYEAELVEKVDSIITGRKQFIKKLIEEARAAEGSNDGFNSDCVADILFGLLREVCLRWRIEGRNFQLKDTILSGLEIILKSI